MPSNVLRILFLGDIVGPVGRKVVKDWLSENREKEKIDFVIANGENATHGHGLSYEHYKELLAAGIDVLTSGNHFLNCKDPFDPRFDFQKEIRPLNLDPACPLKGTIKVLVKGVPVRVSNLLGRVYIPMAQNNPFTALEQVLKDDGEKGIHIVDFHAEATAEKRCLAEYFDGRVTAVIGTHTHVQTNDAKLLNKGTFFLTDAGMNAAYDSVLGDIKDASIYRTRTGLPSPFDVPRKGRGLVNGVLLDVDAESQKVSGFRLINETKEDDLG